MPLLNVGLSLALILLFAGGALPSGQGRAIWVPLCTTGQSIRLDIPNDDPPLAPHMSQACHAVCDNRDKPNLKKRTA